jgi:hypothetical protein
MRHFLNRRLGPQPVAVTSLSRRLQLARTPLHPVRGAGTSQRLATPDWATARTEALTTIATTAETKLNPTPLALGEAVLLNRHEAPVRRFLDMELRLW